MSIRQVLLSIVVILIISACLTAFTPISEEKVIQAEGTITFMGIVDSENDDSLEYYVYRLVDGDNFCYYAVGDSRVTPQIVSNCNFD